jgi:hypothetical protein
LFRGGYSKGLFIWVGAFGKVAWWLDEKLSSGILMLAFAIYILLLYTLKA